MSFKNRLKNLSIVNRITFWYTLFFSILTLSVLFGIYMISSNLLTSQEKSVLSLVVKDALEDYEAGEVFESFDDGVYLSLYKVDGTFIQGTTQIEISENSFKNGRITEIETDTGIYLYKDIYSEKNKEWIRGVMSVTTTTTFIQSLLKDIILILPIILFIILITGYFIVRKALNPVKNMVKTTKEIEKSLDLSKRIDLHANDDELSYLAKSFNTMMDRVENSYSREKEFTANVSHEMRTPLAVMLSESQVGLEESNDENSIKHFIKIERQARQLNSLVTQLLELTRLDSWDKIELEYYNISDLIETLMSDFKILTNSKQIKLSTKIQKNIYHKGNQLLIKRVITNLMSNAIKFTNSFIHFSLIEKNGEIEICIANDGEKIQDEHLSKIFDRLYQIESSRNKEKTQGNGLGLSFVKRIVELHKGKIEVISTEKNTEFKIFI